MKSGTPTSEHIYTLGIASRLSEIPVHSIRQYIDKGLILPYKTETKRHLFSETDIQRLKNIKKYIDGGLNIAGIKTLYAQIPGYLINSCTDKECERCKAFHSSHQPCWVANKNDMNCKDKDCRICDVYRMADPIEDLKRFLLTFKKN